MVQFINNLSSLTSKRKRMAKKKVKEKEEQK